MTLSLCQQTLTIQRIYFILCDRDQFEFNIIWKRFKTTNFNSIGAHFQSFVGASLLLFSFYRSMLFTWLLVIFNFHLSFVY